MTDYKNAIVNLTLSMTLMVAITGCTGAATTQAEHKQQAMDRWTSARAGVMYGVAIQQYETGDFDKAKRAIAQVLEVDPTQPQFNVLAARIALEQNELERAYRHLEIATASDPKSADAHYLTGVIMQRWQRHEAAMTAYLAAYHANPESPAGLIAAGEMLVRSDRSDEAIHLMSDKLVYFEHSAALRMAIARTHMKERRFEQAAAMFRDAYVLAPDDPAVLEQLAMACYAAGKFGDAQYHLVQLLNDESMKDRRDLRLALADCYQQTDRHVNAREAYLALVREEDTDVNAWIKLGQSAWIVGDDTRLREAGQRVAALAPNRHEGYLLQGMANQRIGRTSEAIAMYERASRLAPENALPLIFKGMAFEQAGDAQSAATAYNAALRVEPHSPRAQRLLAGINN